VSEVPSPGRRPRPRPTPTDAPAAGKAEPTPPPAAAPAAAPVPDETAKPAPASRVARRKAAKRADVQARLHRLRLIMIVALVVAVGAGAASVLIAFSGDDGGGKGSGHTSAGTTSAAAAAGAVLANNDQATAFLAAATADVGTVTTFDYRRLDDALQAGLGVTTGAYRTAFQQAMTGAAAAATKTQQVVREFQVLDLGIGQINAAGTQAKVLIFGRQLSSDKDHAQPQPSIVTLCATIVRQGTDRYLIAALDQDGEAGVPPGSSELGRAVEAGRAEVVNALTYTRSQFDADQRRALAGATDPLRGQLTDQSTATKRAMDKGNYDLTGVVVTSAVKSAGGSTVELMVAADSTRAGPGGSDVTTIRYEVTVTEVDGSWLVSQLRALPSE